ncbi:alpha-glucosidase [Paroceanicella profunda]|uniref:Alpha-glucosidase n=2 Tax=Paroceanicella profunda TaxID=2579971 RepID=A0A5B8FXV3_9RHOB|nr:alpha-glucosidase [Paroceanicella profunda]
MPFGAMSASPIQTGQLGGDPDWWRGGVIYQIYPRSFVDLNGDGVGDLAGINSRLDHVAGLGVDAIWISPFFPSPMADFGYDVSDYRGVDPLFGTIQDFDNLLSSAHEKGLRVLLDLVLSHTSDQHSWFQESRVDRTNSRADWYVWADPKPDGTAPNNWLSIFGGPAWEWDTRRRQYYMHNFLAAQPDLNFHNPQVQEAMLNVARFWLERGVDGFRLDTANMYAHDPALTDNPPRSQPAVPGVPEQNPYAMQEPIHNINRPETLEFHERLRKLTDEFNATTLVGELGVVPDMYASLTEYTAPGRLHMAYSFDLLGGEFKAQFFRRTAERMSRRAGECWPSWALSNHDVARAISRWRLGSNAQTAAPLLMAILCSLRGTPCIYQGEELGLTEATIPYELLQDPYGKRFWPEYQGRDGCRTPMPWASGAAHYGFSDATPWLPSAPEHGPLSVNDQDMNEGSVLNRVRRFLRWRGGFDQLRKGDIRFLDADPDVLAFLRQGAEADMLCLFNISDRQRSFETGEFTSVAPLTGHGFSGELLGLGVILPPFEAFFGTVPPQTWG